VRFLEIAAQKQMILGTSPVTPLHHYTGVGRIVAGIEAQNAAISEVIR
jgi:hypothetical protein